MSASKKSQEPAARREPTQQRSRERFERILSVAVSLIRERGSDSLRMSEVAEGAEISIGSLYQYFPDKPSIIRTLAERYSEREHACVRAELETVTARAYLTPALERVLDGYYAMFLEDPAMRDIWSGAQADKTLRELDEADGEAHTQMLLSVLVMLYPKADPTALYNEALLAMQLIASTTRCAIAVDRKTGDALISLFKERALGRLCQGG